MSLLKTACSLGVFHAQFNVVDKQALIKAQKKPEEYKDLLIRVAGYTAYFVELCPAVQDEIIHRTIQDSFVPKNAAINYSHALSSFGISRYLENTK